MTVSFGWGPVEARALGGVLPIEPGSRRLAPRLAALSSVADVPRSPSGTGGTPTASTPPPPCDARHQTPLPDPARSARHPLAPAAACVVVVDVLSFTTAVGVAVEAGAVVHPYRWRDATAAAYAERVGAALAVGRREATPEHPWTLSPAALRAAPTPPRLVLPSPNGSTIAAEAGGATVVAASLRNRTAVARWLADRGYGSADRPLAVIASGERWPDGSLRPALEDLLGAGAVLAALAGTGTGVPTPEASAAATLWAATDDPVAALHGCDSGRELYEYGFPQDVAVAGEIDSSTTVPVLVDGAFQEAAP